ncbi:hypothetical protein EV360DRAFT_76163, partial [Lentinula raphanica]
FTASAEARKRTANASNEPAEDDFNLEDLYTELNDLEDDSGQENDDKEGFAEALNEMSAEEQEEWNEAVKPIRSALFKARKIAFKIVNSPTGLLPHWHALQPNICILPRDVSTRWNSTYNMLYAFVEMKTYVTRLLDSMTNGLGEYQLEDDEWEAIAGLTVALKVIPAMDAIDEALASGMVDNQTMNKYYALTDDSDIYRMAIVLHPQHKLNYFTNAGWKQEWIDSAVEVTRHTWGHYKSSDLLSPETPTVVTENRDKTSSNSFLSLMSKQSQLVSSISKRDELERYLADSCVPTEDPLHWWIMNRKDRAANGVGAPIRDTEDC